MREMRMNLHRTYGPALSDLYNPVTKSLNHHSLSKNLRIAAAPFYPFGFDNYPDINLDVT